jgi:signal transduction histidine kinase
MADPLHILLIDDSNDDRELARRAVASGFPDALFTEVAHAGEFERQVNHRFDCAITDYRLGWGDGLAVLKRLKEKHPELPVIMFTNTGSEEICATGMKSGLSDYIVKRREEFPKLPAAVHTALALAAAHRELQQHQAHIADLLERERAARTEAVRANHLKDEFLATVSHELRTPLSAILGWAHMLQLGHFSREKEQEAYAVIERNARAQAKLIDDILDLSRIVSGTLRIDLSPLDILTTLRAALDAIQLEATAKSITITTQLDPAPPPIRGDAARIQQVVLNLLNNAIKFTPEAGTVHLTLERARSHLQIAVRDSGIGIEPAFLAHIFDRFRQIDIGPTRRHGGLGIGLSVVKSLVEMHGGSVQAFSDGPGKGAKFVVSLPIAVMREQSIAELEEHRMREHQRFDSLKQVAVIAVDDDPDTLTIMRHVLEMHGADVSTASSAKAAMALMRERKYDVLLSDIGMPDEDGFSLITKVRSSAGINWDIPASSVTAFARSQDREKALLSGFDAHLVKPIEPGELVAVVISLLKRRERIKPGV